MAGKIDGRFFLSNSRKRGKSGLGYKNKSRLERAIWVRVLCVLVNVYSHRTLLAQCAR